MTAAPAPAHHGPPGKWIGGLEPSMPLADAVRRVLDVRLAAVERLLPLASDRADEDVEHVHQLRVATRRADAALRIFGSSLPRKRLAKARSRLKRLRRAAGAARECDVHSRLIEDDLEGAPPAPAAKALRATATWIQRRRREAQDAIRDAASDMTPAKLERRRRRLLESVKEKAAGGPTLADACRSQVPALVAALVDADEAGLDDFESLHRLRIAAKRLRYALEVFAPCFGPGFRATYAIVEDLQETLGAVNDANDLAHGIEEFARAGGDGDGALPADALAAGIERWRAKRRERAGHFRAAWGGGGRRSCFEALGALITAAPAAYEAPDIRRVAGASW